MDAGVSGSRKTDMLKFIKKYLTVGTHNLPNRDAWLEKNLQALPPGTKILDAGAGETKYRKFCGHLNYTSQDFGQYNGEGNGEGNQTNVWDNSKLDIVSDITKIPVQTASFDAVLCVEVLEHVPEPINALSELSRILKPGGKLILTLPFCSMTHFAPYFFYTGFSKYWVEKFLPEKGFKIDAIDYNGNYFEYIGQETRRMHRFISKYYSDSKFWFVLTKICALPMVFLLNHLALKSKKSEEVLCYGLNIVAIRI